MDIERVIQKVDDLYSQNRGKEAEQLMLQCIPLAMQEGDDSALLQLLNELLGYYRETSQVENSYAIAAQAISLAKQMGLEGSLHYATTLLNVANAYRAGGRLQDSLQCYLRGREIYQKQLEPTDMLVASLENNISLLYQEMGEYAKAKESLLKALDIVKAKGEDFEVAVTYANLASTCLLLQEAEEAYSYAQLSIETFQSLGVADFHYSAALSALGTYYYGKKQYAEAKSYFSKARDIMEQSLGRNEYYSRLTENMEACDKAIVAVREEMKETQSSKVENQQKPTQEQKKGLVLCKEYYEAYGKPMIEELFTEYAGKIAVGLVGEGSDCFGYDDEISRDHDWGPEFCMWVTNETYAQIGEALEFAYEQLPKEFQGCQRAETMQGKGRRGVMTISAFYKRLLQTDDWEQIDWHQVSDASLAAAVNGEVFRDDEGIFSAFREKLKKGYPENIQYLKLAESAARFAQAGQYNYSRVLQRGDEVTARIMLGDAMREAMKCKHYLEGTYPPHDKWLCRSTEELPGGEVLCGLLGLLKDGNRQAATSEKKAAPYKDVISGQQDNRSNSDILEQIASILAQEMYEKNFISDIDPYLDTHTEELLSKATLSVYSNEELVEKIAKLEFEAFDKVKNEGGRADCQNDWATFSIMRKSQYLTWNRNMLLQYYYDFYREYRRGHNLIEEKYGRMMESTAPDEYEKIKNYFPTLTPEKKAIIEEIVRLQVGWMEEFAAQYPHLADNARSVHTAEDNLYNTSYETYLRGEISTYSDKMLELYGRFVVEYAMAGRNLAYDIMTNSVHLYGYENLEAAERFLGL